MSDPFDPAPEGDADGKDPEEEDAESYYGMEAIGIDPPEVAVPDATAEFESGDVDPQLRTLFWKVVLAVKLTLLTLTIGTLLVITGENPTLGRRVLVLAAVLAGYTVYQYRTSKQRIESGEFDSTDEEGPDSGESPGGSATDGDSMAADESDENPHEPGVEGT